MKTFIQFISIVFILLVAIPAARALEPHEVMVVANMNAADSRVLALYYMEKRQIPKQNLVMLYMTDKETCSRQSYEHKAVPYVRQALEANPDIRALVTMYGLPLRISSPGYTSAEKKNLDRLTKEKSGLELLLETDKKYKKQLDRVSQRIRHLKRASDKVASFDSELMLVKKEGYSLNFWLRNPFFAGWNRHKTVIKKTDVLMVSRLDGADADIVKRIINDSITSENKGLEGTAYFDARWKDPGDKNVSGYGLYDRSIHRAAGIISEKTTMDVVLDDTQALFQKGQSPNAAFYCGWYSLGNYIDAFTWQKGSVGFHIASRECQTLKNTSSRVWCKKMLDEGVAATVGPVGEPYVQSFPMPEIFFDILAQGHLTLAEAYLVSLPYVSWKMVLVGDPLYRIHLKS